MPASLRRTPCSKSKNILRRSSYFSSILFSSSFSLPSSSSIASPSTSFSFFFSRATACFRLQHEIEILCPFRTAMVMGNSEANKIIIKNTVVFRIRHCTVRLQTWSILGDKRDKPAYSCQKHTHQIVTLNTEKTRLTIDSWCARELTSHVMENSAFFPDENENQIRTISTATRNNPTSHDPILCSTKIRNDLVVSLQPFDFDDDRGLLW